MDDRPYLSIGDVLTLLQREFPDVTISKIRFLESRGLLVPERTPSGYRKFYDHDVERLRWILRQQREHFLPLKVIKGRLEGQDSSRPPALFEMGEPAPLADSGASEVGSQAGEGERAVAAPAEQAEAVAGGAAGKGEADATAGSSRFAYSTTSRSGLDRSSSNGLMASMPSRAVAGGGGERAAQVAAATGPLGGSEVTGGAAHPSGGGELRGGASGAAQERADRATHDPQSAGTAAKASGGGSGELAPAYGTMTSRTTASGPLEAAPASPEGASAPRGATGGERAPTEPAGAARGLSALTGVSLTAAELAQASGLTVQQVAELESYGLIETRTVAGVGCYDEEALVVAALAAGFARFGVEARHLRVFKYAAERQTGLYSQIVLPLLRQRNPEARRRALEDVKQLSELGSSLQASFAKAALRDLTGA